MTLFTKKVGTLFGGVLSGHRVEVDLPGVACGVVVGFDLGDIEHADSLHNIDGVSFDFMRKAAEAHVARGGLVTFSWHPDNLFTGGDAWDISSDSVVVSILPGGKHHEEFMGWLKRAADFLESIKDPQGNPIKAIYRPWHEHMARWFWWGAPHCTKEQYIALWKLNYDYFVKERGLTNLVWAFSPNGDVDKEGYMERYPGDDMVDILGLDAYQKDGMEVAAVQALLKDRLAYMKELAAEHGKRQDNRPHRDGIRVHPRSAVVDGHARPGARRQRHQLRPHLAQRL